MQRPGLLMALALALVLCACCALAEEEAILETDDFRYVVREDGSAELIEYVGPDGDVIIPNELDRHPITAVRQNPFMNKRVSVSVYQDHDRLFFPFFVLMFPARFYLLIARRVPGRFLFGKLRLVSVILFDRIPAARLF